jgi:hypothetical protein
MPRQGAPARKTSVAGSGGLAPRDGLDRKGSSGESGRTRFHENRQLVVQPHPRQLRAPPRVIARRQAFRIFQGAGGDIYLVREMTGLKGQRGPTARAEGTRAVIRRSKGRGLIREESEAGARYGDPGDKGRGADSSANRTVAARLVEGGTLRLILDEAAKTMTVRHAIALLHLADFRCRPEPQSLRCRREDVNHDIASGASPGSAPRGFPACIGRSATISRLAR